MGFADGAKMAEGVRQRILDAALSIVENDGFKAMTQPRVARAAGVRQSHITYYFPKRADLAVALLEHSHARAAASAHANSGLLETLPELMFRSERMTFFLGVLVEATTDPELHAVMSEHAAALDRAVAVHFGRPFDDPAVRVFVDRLRGMGIRALLNSPAERPNLDELARGSGLWP